MHNRFVLILSNLVSLIISGINLSKLLLLSICVKSEVDFYLGEKIKVVTVIDLIPIKQCSQCLYFFIKNSEEYNYTVFMQKTRSD
jgi:hypothetical protein